MRHAPGGPLRRPVLPAAGHRAGVAAGRAGDPPRRSGLRVGLAGNPWPASQRAPPVRGPDRIGIFATEVAVRRYLSRLVTRAQGAVAPAPMSPAPSGGALGPEVSDPFEVMEPSV